jgi:hypothetical protein
MMRPTDLMDNILHPHVTMYLSIMSMLILAIVLLAVVRLFTDSDIIYLESEDFADMSTVPIMDLRLFDPTDG